MAWLGGGSLAAGGAGVAGGMAVMGGLIAAPALLVLGFYTGAKASENLENAKAELAEARAFKEQMITASHAAYAIARRSYLLHRLLIRLSARFAPLFAKMNEIIEQKGTDFSRFSDEQKAIIAQVAALAGSQKAILDTPVLKNNGELSTESGKIAEKIQKGLPSYEK